MDFAFARAFITDAHGSDFSAGVFANAISGEAAIDDGVVIAVAIVVDDRRLAIDGVHAIAREAMLIGTRIAESSPLHERERVHADPEIKTEPDVAVAIIET